MTGYRAVRGVMRPPGAVKAAGMWLSGVSWLGFQLERGKYEPCGKLANGTCLSQQLCDIPAAVD